MIELLTVKEASQRLRTSRQHLYRLIAEQSVKGFKSDSGKYLIYATSLDAYVETCYNQYAHRLAASGGINYAE